MYLILAVFTEWGDWSTCSKSCDGGLQSRNGTEHGTICQKKLVSCNMMPCDGTPLSITDITNVTKSPKLCRYTHTYNTIVVSLSLQMYCWCYITYTSKKFALNFNVDLLCLSYTMCTEISLFTNCVKYSSLDTL